MCEYVFRFVSINNEAVSGSSAALMGTIGNFSERSVVKMVTLKFRN